MDETPKLTLGEGLTALGTIVTIVPHLPNPVVSAFIFVPAYGAVWALRRSAVLRAWVESQQTKFRTTDLRFKALRSLPVPPAGTPLLGDGSDEESAHQRDVTPARQRATKVVSEAADSLKPRIPASMTALFGNDNPLEAQTQAAQVSKRDSRALREAVRAAEVAEKEEIEPLARSGEPTQAVVEAQTPQKEARSVPVGQPKAQKEDDSWLHRHSGAPMVAPKPTGRLMTVREVCTLLNDEVDDRPHTIVVGDSGAGKTILVQLLIGTRPGKVVILDPKRPKGWEPPKWGGLPYVSRDRNSSYAEMVAALKLVVKEMDWRYQHQEEATEPFAPITVVLDEAKNSVEECEALSEQYRKIVSIGREVGIRLILLTTTDRARKLGFEGEADSLESLAWVRLGNMAKEVLGDAQAFSMGDKRYHWAAIRLARWVPFDNSKTFDYVQQLRLNKAWEGVKYNCQVQKEADAEEPLLRLPPPRREPIAASGGEEAPNELLAQLFALAPHTMAKYGGSVNLIEGEVAAEVSTEVPNEVKSLRADAEALRPEPKSQFGTSSTSEDSAKTELKAAAELWKITTPEVREVVKKALQLHVKDGKSKTAAIREVSGVGGGDKFQAYSKAFDAGLLLHRQVASKKKA